MNYIYLYISHQPTYIYIERERYIIKFCVCKMPAAAHGLKGYETNSLQTDRPNWSFRHADRQSGFYCCILQLKITCFINLYLRHVKNIKPRLLMARWLFIKRYTLIILFLPMHFKLNLNCVYNVYILMGGGVVIHSSVRIP